MKKTYRILLLAIVIILVLAACSPKPAATVNPPASQATAAPSSAQASTAAPSGQAKSDAEMQALITEKIHDKHTLDFILSQNKTAEQWSRTLDDMINRGAKISPDEKTLIINWLVSRNK